MKAIVYDPAHSLHICFQLIRVHILLKSSHITSPGSELEAENTRWGVAGRRPMLLGSSHASILLGLCRVPHGYIGVNGGVRKYLRFMRFTLLFSPANV